ncbi:MAG: 6-pyruvoyl tetrahydrobiopterin synthase [Myxococcales bacterium]|nr:6-pyruvoyl tetrahydrobiopterin synthase [Myxococcales bacterium]
MNVAVSRRYRFAAAHVLRSDALSDEENRRVYGKCSNLHGHDYGFEVEVTGPVDPISGQIIAPERLDGLVERHVLGPLAHSDLSQHPWFAERVSTAENVARVIHEQLESPIAGEGRARLASIRVQETRRNGFEYGGEAER